MWAFRLGLASARAVFWGPFGRELAHDSEGGFGVFGLGQAEHGDVAVLHGHEGLAPELGGGLGVEVLVVDEPEAVDAVVVTDEGSVGQEASVDSATVHADPNFEDLGGHGASHELRAVDLDFVVLAVPGVEHLDVVEAAVVWRLGGIEDGHSVVEGSGVGLGRAVVVLDQPLESEGQGQEAHEDKVEDEGGGAVVVGTAVVRGRHGNSSHLGF